MYSNHLEDFIKVMYNEIGIDTPEQLHIPTIAYRLGVKLFYWKEASQALFIRGAQFIFLNSSLSPAAQWQDFCHELGHVLLHFGNQRFMNPMFRKYQERKANNFMYHACVPTFMLDSLHIKNSTIHTIHKIQLLFNVEYNFARQRLNQYMLNKNNSLNWNGTY